jgi:general secretion pathway protein K
VQSGAALLLAMLTLALMAEIAALVVADYGSVMELLVGRQDQSQSRWLARGAIDWARNVLSEDARTTNKLDHLGELWATRVPPTAVEDGEVSGEIIDYSGFFDLNSIVVAGVVNNDQLEAYKRLLLALGLPQRDVLSLAAALVDWLDVNSVPEQYGAEASWYASAGRSYQPANAPLIDFDEVKLIRGYNEDVVNRLRSVAVALPETAPVNFNTASPEVLVALIQNLSIDQAKALVVRRLTAPVTQYSLIRDQLPPTAVVPPESRLSVWSRYFLASGRAKYGQAVSRMQVLLDRKSNWSEIVWQKVL